MAWNLMTPSTILTGNAYALQSSHRLSFHRKIGKPFHSKCDHPHRPIIMSSLNLKSTNINTHTHTHTKPLFLNTIQQQSFRNKKQMNMHPYPSNAYLYPFFSNKNTFYYYHYSNQQSRLYSMTSHHQHNSHQWDTITSTKNPLIKSFKTLLTKKNKRNEQNMTVVEGHRLVMDLLTNDKTLKYIQNILVTEQALDNHDLYNLLMELEQTKTKTTAKHDIIMKITVVTEKVLQECCDTITPQGIVATCTIPKPFEPTNTHSHTHNYNHNHNDNDNDNDNDTHQSKKPQLFLVLDGISDPGNMGTLLRTSAAVGVTAAILLPHCTDVWSPKAIRSSMGASFHVPILSVSSVEECFHVLENCGCCVKHDFYAATMDVKDDHNANANANANANHDRNGNKLSTSPAHFEINWATSINDDSPKISALCIGKEGSGLSLSIRDSVSKGHIKSVHVPMEETGVVESLNAAVCGSVILFEYSRQKHLYSKQIKENIMD